MAAQSNIPFSKSTLQSLPDLLRDPDIRAFQIVIANEQLEISKQIPKANDLSHEFGELSKSLSLNTPCYYLINIGDILTNNIGAHVEKNENPNATDSTQARNPENKWLNALYVPDSSPIKMKMLYSSSRQAVLNAVGSANYKSDLFATDASDLSEHVIIQFLNTLEYSDKNTQNHEDSGIHENEHYDQASPPFKATGGYNSKSRNGKHNSRGGTDENDNEEESEQGYPSVVVPERTPSISHLDMELTKEAKQSLHSLHYFSETEPRFGYFLYRHSTSTGSNRQLIQHPALLSEIEDNCPNVPIFIYSCPEQSPVRMKMVYSVTKASLLNIVQSEVGLVEKLRIEVSSPATELTTQFFIQKLNSLKVSSSTVNSNASSSIRSASVFDDSGTWALNNHKPMLVSGPKKFAKPMAPSRSQQSKKKPQ
ncbi:hypothetical protein BB560_006940 [Smittium megazygosporum]|uniref:ADF-H domain-containing protein n=1 Tax=Smittium megazygosporum TaxID=133381 RepID=A0A2T9Y057_9FUNG|nr:hypothetical protein BB560_006940 [Smittium megazygosporum]